MINVKELNNKKTIKKVVPIKPQVVNETSIQKKIESNLEFDQYLDSGVSRGNDEFNQYLENKDSEAEESEQKSVDDKSERESVAEESEHNSADGNVSDNGESIDEEFESYWTSNNSPIVRDLVFEKTNDNDYY